MRDESPQEQKQAGVVFPFQGFLVGEMLHLQGQRINDDTVLQLIAFLRKNPLITTADSQVKCNTPPMAL